MMGLCWTPRFLTLLSTDWMYWSLSIAMECITFLSIGANVLHTSLMTSRPSTSSSFQHRSSKSGHYLHFKDWILFLQKIKNVRLVLKGPVLRTRKRPEPTEPELMEPDFRSRSYCFWNWSGPRSSSVSKICWTAQNRFRTGPGAIME